MSTIILTGASDGIGAAAAKVLRAEPNHRLILVGRNPDKTRAVAGQLGADYHVADFSSLDEVRGLARTLDDKCDQIDVLANNAGGIFDGPVRTADGFEKSFQVNHLAPYLLTNLLIDKLLASRATVVNTASIAARLFGEPDIHDLNGWGDFTPNRAYGNAKLANIVFAKQLHERFHDQGLNAVAFHPGVISTSFAGETSGLMNRLYQGVFARFLDSPDKGALRLVHFITGQPGVDWESGEFYGDNLKPARSHPRTLDRRFRERHFELSAQMLAVRWPNASTIPPE